MRRPALGLVLLTAAFAALGIGGSPAAPTFRAVDTRLCPFPLEITVAGKAGTGETSTTALRFTFSGPRTITLRNGRTGRIAVLRATGSYSVDTRTGTITFGGRQVWFWSTGKHVPFLITDGTGRLKAPSFVLAPGSSRARTVDPCALVAPAAPPTAPRRTPAPWPAPRYALSRIAYSGLTPLLGTPIRHDHVHLDVIVDGREVTVPAGVGIAEPADTGPCPPLGGKRGDCATGHVYFGQVANAPLHTHSASGLIHIEADRRGRYTLGQFFDEWGVRLDARCVGGYCTSGKKELRVFVDGRRRRGDPRAIVLGNHQELAVVYGGSGAFRRVPRSYAGGWPGGGCGGPGERSCLPA
jgi:hypothetical protein